MIWYDTMAYHTLVAPYLVCVVGLIESQDGGLAGGQVSWHTAPAPPHLATIISMVDITIIIMVTEALTIPKNIPITMVLTMGMYPGGGEGEEQDEPWNSPPQL